MAYVKKTAAKQLKQSKPQPKKTKPQSRVAKSQPKLTKTQAAVKAPLKQIKTESKKKVFRPVVNSQSIRAKKNLNSDFWVVSVVIFFAITSFMAVAAGTTYLSVMTEAGGFSGQEVSKNIAVNIKGAAFNLEVVNSREDMYLGLSGRESLCSSCGMLFVFPDSTSRSFVMRNMNFPLDIIFISQGRIIKIYENLPPEGAFPVNFYNSDAPADVVLEINGGLANRLGLRVGDRLSLPDLSVYK